MKLDIQPQPRASAVPRPLRRLIEWLSRVGALPADPSDVRTRKAAAVLGASLIVVLACVWTGTYFALGLPLAASIPLAYQLISVATLLYLFRTKRFAFFRTSQLVMILLLPFLLQWALGGFVSSSAVMLWAFIGPVGALLYLGPQRAVPWFATYALLAVTSGIIDPSLADRAAAIPAQLRLAFFVLNVGGVSFTAFVLLRYFVGERERAAAALATEQEKSERLLLNVLPKAVAARLKDGEGVIADRFDDVTVLFADIVDFTPLSDRMAPDDVVALLDHIFSRFDALVDGFGLEKIKTIGDAYMAAGGLPVPRSDHAETVADLALCMRDEVARVDVGGRKGLAVRIGIDTGPVVAGVIGTRKFIYDLWGDTVNTASRMESHGVPGAVQVTDRTYALLRDRFRFEPRGEIQIKGKGRMATYILVERIDTGTAHETVSRAKAP
jgi:adenylate cyclase